MRDETCPRVEIKYAIEQAMVVMRRKNRPVEAKSAEMKLCSRGSNRVCHSNDVNCSAVFSLSLSLTRNVCWGVVALCPPFVCVCSDCEVWPVPAPEPSSAISLQYVVKESSTYVSTFTHQAHHTLYESNTFLHLPGSTCSVFLCGWRDESTTPAQCAECFTTSGLSFLQQDLRDSISTVHSLSW